MPGSVPLGMGEGRSFPSPGRPRGAWAPIRRSPGEKVLGRGAPLLAARGGRGHGRARKAEASVRRGQRSQAAVGRGAGGGSGAVVGFAESPGDRRGRRSAFEFLSSQMLKSRTDEALSDLLSLSLL